MDDYYVNFEYDYDELKDLYLFLDDPRLPRHIKLKFYDKGSTIAMFNDCFAKLIRVSRQETDCEPIGREVHNKCGSFRKYLFNPVGNLLFCILSSERRCKQVQKFIQKKKELLETSKLFLEKVEKLR